VLWDGSLEPSHFCRAPRLMRVREGASVARERVMGPLIELRVCRTNLVLCPRGGEHDQKHQFLLDVVKLMLIVCLHENNITCFDRAIFCRLIPD
jgi:hypothetical protein